MDDMNITIELDGKETDIYFDEGINYRLLQDIIEYLPEFDQAKKEYLKKEAEEQNILPEVQHLYEVSLSHVEVESNPLRVSLIYYGDVVNIQFAADFIYDGTQWVKDEFYFY